MVALVAPKNHCQTRATQHFCLKDIDMFVAKNVRLFFAGICVLLIPKKNLEKKNIIKFIQPKVNLNCCQAFWGQNALTFHHHHVGLAPPRDATGAWRGRCSRHPVLHRDATAGRGGQPLNCWVGRLEGAGTTEPGTSNMLFLNIEISNHSFKPFQDVSSTTFLGKTFGDGVLCDERTEQPQTSMNLEN